MSVSLAALLLVVSLSADDTVVVDDRSPGFLRFQSAGNAAHWWYRNLAGRGWWDDNLTFTYQVNGAKSNPRNHDENWGCWQAPITKAGRYVPYAYVPNVSTPTIPKALTGQATYRLAWQGGSVMSTVDQNSNRGHWVRLAASTGIFLPAGSNATITLGDLSSEAHNSRIVAFDAIRWSPVGAPAPDPGPGPLPTPGPTPESGPQIAQVLGVTPLTQGDLYIATARAYGNKQLRTVITLIISGRTYSSSFVRGSNTGRLEPSTYASGINGTRNREIPDREPIVLDLRAAGVPKFIGDTRFDVRLEVFDGSKKLRGETKRAVLFAPLIIVPGIALDLLPGNVVGSLGPNGTFRELEEKLRIESTTLLQSEDRLGVPLLPPVNDFEVIPRSAPLGLRKTRTPSVFTFQYDRDRDNFGYAGDRLANLVQTVIGYETYFDKADIVTHSKGGLVSRAYLAANKSNPHVDRCIWTVPPNTGSLLGFVGKRLYREYAILTPTYPWKSSSLNGDLTSPFDDRNDVLDLLNARGLPRSVRYRLFTSQWGMTAAFFTANDSFWARLFDGLTDAVPGVKIYRALRRLTEIGTDCRVGDGVVPLFSQLGYQVVNRRNEWSSRIPAFQGINLPREERIDAMHIGYLNNPDVDQRIWDILHAGG